MKRNGKVTQIAATILAALCSIAAHAQDKYSLKSASGIAFSDQDWSVVSE